MYSEAEHHATKKGLDPARIQPGMDTDFTDLREAEVENRKGVLDDLIS
jgi:hypothetical protein